MREAVRDEAGVLRERVVHHQPTPIISTNTKAIAAGANLRDFSLGSASDFGTTGARCSHGSTMRNRSIGTEMFFRSVGASFSNRASNALRIWRSTSIDTQIPPAPASG